MLGRHLPSRRGLAACLSLAASCVAHGARAQSTPATASEAPGASAPAPERSAGERRARELYQRGEQSYAAGDYAAAVRAFDEAYDLSPRPELLFNAANALERWGCYAQAASYLERYAKLEVNAPQAVNARLVVLRGRDVSNDRGMPRCPGDRADADSVPAPVASPPPPPAGPLVDDDSSASTRQIMGYSLLGLSAVSLGTGLLFGLSSLGDTQTVEDRCLGSGLCPTSAGTPLDESESSALVADVGVGVGLVALGAGLYLVLGGASGPSVSAQVSAQGAGLTLEGAF